MNRIEQAVVHVETIYQTWILAPNVAGHTHAGQLIILRINESLKRISLAISVVKGDCFRFIFMTMRNIFEQRSTYEGGNNFSDVQQSLGRDSEIANYKTCAVEEREIGIVGSSLVAREVRV